jgi:hypothetical protein
MKRISLLLLMVIFSLFALAGAQEKGERAKKVEASGQALWDYLKKVDYAKNWKMWPGKKPFYKGTEPHGALLTTYVNDIALKGIQEKKGTLPDGSIIVKENYSPDKKLGALTVMLKEKGYHPPAADWFWVKYGPDGKIETEGKVEGCIDCHGKAKGNDYLFTGSLKK